MTRLARAVQDFLERRLLGERIDDLPLTADQRDARKADYLLLDRSVIVELKDLVDDRVAPIKAIIDRWRDQPGWPLVYGAVDLQEILRVHPRGTQINEELFQAVLNSLESVVRAANQQLRTTRETFAIPDAHGVLFLVNDAVDLLDPELLGGTLKRLLTKRTRDGELRFPDVDSTVVFTTAHDAVNVEGVRHHPIYSVYRPDVYPVGMEGSFDEFVFEHWAAFLGKRLERADVIESREALEALKFVGKRPPLAI